MEQPRKGAKSAEVIMVVRLMRILEAMPMALQESNRIKVNQTKSNQIKPAGLGGWSPNHYRPAGGLIQKVGLFGTTDSVGGTPTGAVETTALPNKLDQAQSN
jgi:hypothetical protein